MVKGTPEKEETVEEAQQAENSPDTFVILMVSLVVLVIIGAGLLWYFGMFGGVSSPSK